MTKDYTKLEELNLTKSIKDIRRTDHTIWTINIIPIC